MKKRLSLLFLAFSMTAEANRSVLRDNENAMQSKHDDDVRVRCSEKPACNPSNNTSKKVKQETKKTQKAPKKKAQKKEAQPVVEQNSSDDVMNHPHRSVLRYEWAEQPEVAPVVSERTKKREAKKLAAKQQQHYYCTLPDKEEFSKILYTTLAAGFVKYLIPTTDIVRPGGNIATLKLAHADMTPLVRAGFGVELTGLRCLYDEDKTTRARVGFEATFAKSTNSVDTLYTTTDSAVPNLRGLQSIQRGELMGVFSYDIVRDMLAFEAGLGLVAGALKGLHLYEPGTNGNGQVYTTNVKAYNLPNLISIGQSLKPNNGSVGGFIGLTLAHTFECFNDTRIELGYRSVFSKTSYKTRVYQTVPSPLASIAYQNAYQLVQANGPIVLPKSPSMKIRAQELTLAVVLEF